MLNICELIFSNFDEQNINYCHWKSNEHLEAGLNGETDLDILVDPKDKDRCLAVYKQLQILACKPQFGSRYPNVEDYIAFDKETGRLIHLHQHYKIVTGHTGLKEYVLPHDQVVLNTKIKDKQTGIYIIKPEAELYILYLRIILKSYPDTYRQAQKGKFKIKDDYCREINYLKSLCTRESCQDFYNAYDFDTAMVPFIWDEELNAKSFCSLYEYVNQKYENYSRYSPIKTKILTKIFPHLIRCNRFLRKKLNKSILIKKSVPGEGISIAFIGQDGSGKSTITQEIEKWFLWKMDAQRFYLGSGEHYNPWQKKCLKAVSSKKNKSVLFSYISGMLSVSLCYSVSRYNLAQLKCARKYIAKGGIALYDRFPQTQFPGIYDGPKIRELYLRKTSNPLLRAIIACYASREEANIAKAQKYNPDLVFKLILSVDETMRRKPENDRGIIEQKNAITKKLVFPDSYVITVDAEQPYNDELLYIKNKIWSDLFNKENSEGGNDC